jgi:hypothetical protein
MHFFKILFVQYILTFFNPTDGVFFKEEGHMRTLLGLVLAACCVIGLVGETAHVEAFQSSVCRPGYVQVGPRLCMTALRGPHSFGNAHVDCQDNFGRIATYGDWYYRHQRVNGNPLPVVGVWLGDTTGNNLVLFVNSSNIGNFDGETSRGDVRRYVCAHDDNG